ncbi:hypothetical protein NQ315_006931 [Exocentrus adspersus]|uniref:Ionotropic glutamate receptor C-terminal domain-containing protein n=1 Tax=Exocentrus adspersus TaxID=1586481 RepID=A0AAV8WCU1_9CUCU|nr:hypothetical protein NQ315_006931 [Exocentrus adspersus]
MNLHIDFLANLLLQQYFLNSRCLLIFTDDFNNFTYNGNLPLVQIGIKDKTLHQDLIFRYFGCQGIVIKNNIPLWTLQTVEKLIRLNFERFNSKRYLILQGSKTEETLSDILKLQELSFVADLVVVEEGPKSLGSGNHFITQENAVYSLWTHQYVGAGDGANKKIFLDLWFSDTKRFKYSKDLYGSKLVNQMGRELRMATFQYEPYSIIGCGVYKSKGSEMSTAVAFARQYNMTPVLVVNQEDYWGEIFENWTGVGLLGNLVLDKADIGFAALYSWEAEYHFLDLSNPLVRTGITCLVPAPRLAAGWLTPLYSYSYQIWIAIGVLLLTCIPGLFFLHYFYSKIIQRNISAKYKNRSRLFESSAFTILKLFVLQVVTKEEIPNGFNGRYFMAMMFLFSLFLTNTYSSGFASIMTVPRYENAVNTVEEFAASGLHWGATQDAWIMSIQNAEEVKRKPVYKTIVGRFISATEENLREYSKTRGYAFSVERLPHENFAVGSYIQEDVIGNFHLMQDDFYWEQCVMMTRKSSVLLPLLNQFVLRAFEAGLIGYWQNEAVALYMDSKVQNAVRHYYHHQDRNVVKLEWSHVQGAFGALCLGYCISLIVCLLIFTDDFNNFTYNGNLPIVQVGIKNKTFDQDLIFRYFGYQGIVIKNNVPLWTFQTVEKLIRLNLERFNSRRYLILQGSKTEEDLSGILELQELSFVADLVLVEEHRKSLGSGNNFITQENTVYSLWTHQYVGTDGSSNKKIMLDFWSSDTKTFKYNKDLYQSKLVNQMGRELRMGTLEYGPSAIIGSSAETSKGSELLTAVTFGKQYNMTPVLVLNLKDYWGEIFENWTGTGLLGNLVLDKADVGFSAMFAWEEEYHYLDISKPLVRTGITCLVPAPRLAAGWLTPLRSYSHQMWIAVGSLVFISVLGLFSLRYFHHKVMVNKNSRYGEIFKKNAIQIFQSSAFTILKLLVLQAVANKEIPIGSKGRYFMGLMFLFSLFLTSTYSSGLASIMTVPRYENPIDTIEQFVDSGLYWGATDEVWITSIEDAEQVQTTTLKILLTVSNVFQPIYKAVVEKFIATSEEKLRELSKTGKYAFGMERLPHVSNSVPLPENFAIGSYLKADVIGNFHLMQDDLYWEHYVIMTRKSSVLLPLLDLFILRLFEAGLIGYWQNEAVTLYMDSKIQQVVKYNYHHQDRVVVKLKWSHVQGAFGVLCLGYTASLFQTFWLES